MTRASTTLRLLSLLAAAALLLACATTETTAEPWGTETPIDARPSDARLAEGAVVTPIRIGFAGRQLDATLGDNPTADDLAARLPLTLSFRDLNNVEKIAELPSPLTMDGVPAGDDPDIGDIGYYAPTNHLVLYYGDVGYWEGIVRIGRLSDTDLQLIAGQPDGFEVTVGQG